MMHGRSKPAPAIPFQGPRSALLHLRRFWQWTCSRAAWAIAAAKRPVDAIATTSGFRYAYRYTSHKYMHNRLLLLLWRTQVHNSLKAGWKQTKPQSSLKKKEEEKPPPYENYGPNSDSTLLA